MNVHHRDTEYTEVNVRTCPPGGTGGFTKVDLGVLGVSVVNR